MWISNHCTFYHFRMCINGIFYFCCANSMSRNIDHIIHPAYDAIITVLIPLCPITRKIMVFEPGEIILAAAFMVAAGVVGVGYVGWRVPTREGVLAERARAAGGGDGA